MASIIRCGSCGAQYDGSQLQAGVQFQCTNCGAMVQVGGAQARPAGMAPRAAKGGPAPARGPVAPARGKVSMQQPAQQPFGAGFGQKPPMAAPAKGGSTGLVVGGIVGAVVLVLVVVVVVSSSGHKDAEQDRQQAQKKEIDARKEEAAKKAEEAKAVEAARKTALDAIDAVANKLPGPISSGDTATLDSLFAWDDVAAYFVEALNKQSKDPGKPDKNGKPTLSAYEKFQNNPAFVHGEWQKMSDGRWSGTYRGTTPRTGSELKARILEHFKLTYEGVQAVIEWDRMEKEKGNIYEMSLGAKKFIARKVWITSPAMKGKSLIFHVAAEAGSSDARVRFLEDPNMLAAIQAREAPYKSNQPEDTGNRDPYNPDRRPPDGETPGTEEPGEPGPSDLPAAQKTGCAEPTNAQLLNIYRALKKGERLKQAQISVLQDSTIPKQEKKDFIGACVDILIDAHGRKDRATLNNVTWSMFQVWGRMIGFPESDVVVPIQGYNDEEDYFLRAWYDFWKNYKA